MSSDMAFAKFIDDLLSDAPRRYRLQKREKWTEPFSVTFQRRYDEETKQKLRYLRHEAGVRAA